MQNFDAKKSIEIASKAYHLFVDFLINNLDFNTTS
jgi:hypothetical protein